MINIKAIKFSLYILTITLHGEFFYRNAAKADLNDCGPSCAHAIIQQYSTRPYQSYSKFLKEYGPISGQGSSLLKVAECFEKHDLKTLAVESTNLQDLENFCQQWSVIAHLRSGHFVIVKKVLGRDVEIADPPNVQRISRRNFQEKWSGKLLLVSDREIHLSRNAWPVRTLLACFLFIVGLCGVGLYLRGRPNRGRVFALLAISGIVGLVEGCLPSNQVVATKESAVVSEDPSPKDYVKNLIVKTSGETSTAVHEMSPATIEDRGEIAIVSVGEIPNTGKLVSAKFLIENRNSFPVRISSTKSSCGCTNIDFKRLELLPGQDTLASLSLQVGADGRRGASVIVEFDQPFVSSKQISIEWNSVSLVRFAEDRKDLGTLSANKTHVFEIPIRYDESSTLDPNDLSLTCEKWFSKAEFSEDRKMVRVELTPPSSDEYDRVLIWHSSNLMCSLNFVWHFDRAHAFSTDRLFFGELSSGKDREFEVEYPTGLQSKVDNAEVSLDCPGSVRIAKAKDGILILSYTAPFVEMPQTIIGYVLLNSSAEQLGKFKLVGRVTK
jgi:hypothetical protein